MTVVRVVKGVLFVGTFLAMSPQPAGSAGIPESPIIVSLDVALPIPRAGILAKDRKANWCQECLVTDFPGVPDGRYGIYWVYNHICPYGEHEHDIDGCVICVGELCSTEDQQFSSAPETFETPAEAQAWAFQQSDCGNCDPLEQEDDVVRAASDGRLMSVANLIRSSGGRLWLNDERGAIQGFGCNNDGIGVHIPVDPALFRSLRAVARGAPRDAI
jgi:hypothetical protein